MTSASARSLHMSSTAVMQASERSSAFVRERWPECFDVAVVAGSGIDQSVRDWQLIDRMAYASIPGFSSSTVHGHRGELLWMQHERKNVLVFLGRRHLYEGCSILTTVVNPLLASAVGCTAFVLSNAAGGMKSTMKAGDLMLAHDLVNATHRCMCIDTTQRRPLLDAEYRKIVQNDVYTHTEDAKTWLHEGVYISVTGPSYETRAEVRMYSLFADAIGMSSILEAQAATQLGMRTLCVSVISNTLGTTGVSAHKLTHDEVLQTAQASTSRMEKVLASAVRHGGSLL